MNIHVLIAIYFIFYSLLIEKIMLHNKNEHIIIFQRHGVHGSRISAYFLYSKILNKFL